MGADPTREASECGHPGINSVDNTQKATATDEYATRHDPFVYFHSIIDDTALCDSHVVNLSLLPHDLATAADTPNYVFITPDLCDDGHDSPCANGQPGGLAQADQFLRQWVPQITSSPAFTQQRGLLIITFDEADTSDTTSCCGEIPGPGSPEPGVNGPGGGDVGAVLLSPCIAPGTVSTVAVQPLHDAAKRRGHVRPAAYRLRRAPRRDVVRLGHLHPVVHRRQLIATPAGDACPRARDRVERRRDPANPGELERSPEVGAVFTAQVRDTHSSTSAWRTLLTSTAKRSLKFAGRLGQTYEFQVRAVAADGDPGPWSSATTVVPTGLHPAGGHYRGAWHVRRVRSAWEGHAIVSSTAGARFTLRYTGGELALIGDRWPQGGRIRVTLDGHGHTINLYSARPHARQVLFLERVRSGHHRLTIRVLSGTVALEGLAIGSRRADRAPRNGPMAGPGFEPGKAEPRVYSPSPLTARESRREA